MVFLLSTILFGSIQFRYYQNKDFEHGYRYQRQQNNQHQIEASEIWLADNLRQNMKLSLKLIVFDGKLCHSSEEKRLWAQRLTLSDATGNDWFIYLKWCTFFFQLRDLPTLEYWSNFDVKRARKRWKIEFFPFLRPNFIYFRFPQLENDKVNCSLCPNIEKKWIKRPQCLRPGQKLLFRTHVWMASVR